MFSRHDLIWLSARGWERACAAAPPAARATIARWGAAGWPAVITRLPAGLAPGQVALGIALPPRPDGSKPRIAITADADDILRTSAALALADAMSAAPAAWRTALARLDGDAAEAGLTLRVYGSLAFQALTGQVYLRPGSDIDLLLHPAGATACMHALTLLARHARVLPLDGEIVFGNDHAVAWKELAGYSNGQASNGQASNGQARVLAKSLHGIGLVTVDSLLASLDKEVPCTA